MPHLFISTRLRSFICITCISHSWLVMFLQSLARSEHPKCRGSPRVPRIITPLMLTPQELHFTSPPTSIADLKPEARRGPRLYLTCPSRASRDRFFSTTTALSKSMDIEVHLPQGLLVQMAESLLTSWGSLCES